MARKPHFLNSGLMGQPAGYSMRVHHYAGRKAIYAVTVDKATPLTWVDATGAHWRPNWYALTDWGSVPAVLQMACPKDSCIGFLFHDSAYEHGGLWWSRSGTSWRFASMDRAEVDSMLYDQVLAQWAARGRAWAIWAGVRVGGWAAWHPERHRPRQDRWRASKPVGEA